LGFAEGFDYMATLLVVADAFERWEETVAAMDAALKELPAVYGGASTLAHGGCIVKLLARSASNLTQAQAALCGLARKMVFNSPVIDLRKY
jgi:hypothetical protein